MVVNNTPIRVKIKSKLTNLMKISRIEGYNGKYGLNPQGISEISDDLFEFDQNRGKHNQTFIRFTFLVVGSKDERTF